MSFMLALQIKWKLISSSTLMENLPNKSKHLLFANNDQSVDGCNAESLMRTKTKSINLINHKSFLFTLSVLTTNLSQQEEQSKTSDPERNEEHQCEGGTLLPCRTIFEDDGERLELGNKRADQSRRFDGQHEETTDSKTSNVKPNINALKSVAI